MSDQGAFTRALEWVMDVDAPALQAAVESLRKARPDLTSRQLAESAFRKATGVGFVTGLPAPSGAGPSRGSGGGMKGMKASPK